jgi:cyclohexanone monooxygenase
VRALLGTAVDDFPNLFMIAGPQTPFGNMPVVMERQITFVGALLEHVHRSGFDRIEVTEAAAAEWKAGVDFLATMSAPLQVAEKYNSWFVGANVEGKPRDTYLYMGGFPMFFHQLDEEAATGYPSFALT